MLADVSKEGGAGTSAKASPPKKTKVETILEGGDDAGRGALDLELPADGDDVETVAGEAVLEAIASGDAKAVGRALTQALRALKTSKER